MKKTFVATLVILLVALVPACKSRKTPPPVTTTGSVADTAPPDIAPPPIQDTTPRVDPPTDFVRDEQPREEVVPTEIEELNRFVQNKGYIRDAFFNYDESTLDDAAQSAGRERDVGTDWRVAER